MVRGPLVQVGATDADIGDFKKDILGADGRLFDFADFDGPFFRSVIDDGGNYAPEKGS